MLAIDTNVLIRYLTGDHPKQSARARALIDSNDVYVADTVMLESEWVLRGVYGFLPSQICAALRAFSGLPRVSVQSPAVIAQVLDRTEEGMDFADALHLGLTEGCDAFATFDRKLIKAARIASIANVQEA
jgi:predicted nucleic acid-binding protein